jgi:hypothetical protein
MMRLAVPGFDTMASSCEALPSFGMEIVAISSESRTFPSLPVVRSCN